MTEKGARFRQLLTRPDVLVLPGGFSPSFAKMCEMVGFDAFFVAGSQTSAFLYGLPDAGIIGLRDMVDHARHIAARTSIPILVDSDTGFGNAVGVFFAAQEMIRAGAAGMTIEDQEAPKKSGTGAGRRCISVEEAVGKYQAAVAARDELDPGFVVCARCDVVGSEGGTFDEAVERCIAYVERGHADMVWINTLQTREQVAEACRRIPAPVLPGWGGGRPSPTIEEYRALGAKMALFPAITTGNALQTTWDLLNDFKERGTVALEEAEARARAGRWGAIHRSRFVDSDRVKDLEQRYLPRSVQRDYDQTFGHTDRGG